MHVDVSDSSMLEISKHEGARLTLLNNGHQVIMCKRYFLQIDRCFAMQKAHPKQIGLIIISTDLTGTDDRFDRLEQPIRSVDCAVQQQAELVVSIFGSS